jgi:hypothetical protein
MATVMTPFGCIARKAKLNLHFTCSSAFSATATYSYFQYSSLAMASPFCKGLSLRIYLPRSLSLVPKHSMTNRLHLSRLLAPPICQKLRVPSTDTMRADVWQHLTNRLFVDRARKVRSSASAVRCLAAAPSDRLWGLADCRWHSHAERVRLVGGAFFLLIIEMTTRRFSGPDRRTPTSQKQGLPEGAGQPPCH